MPLFVTDEIVSAAKLNDATVRDWTTWSPTYSNITVGSGSVVARYVQVGSEHVVLRWQFTFGSGSAIGSNPTVSFPVTTSSTGYTSTRSVIGELAILDSGTAQLVGGCFWNSSTTMGLQVYSASGTYVASTPLTATVPATWATGDILSALAIVELA